MKRLLHAVWDRLSMYLPVILMGILALGTYWLVRSTPVLLAPGQVAPVRHDPDYAMRQFSVRTFDATGRLRSEVLGNHARHYPDTDTLEIDGIQIRSFNEEGRLTTARAQRALTNADGSEVQFFGDAHIVREALALPGGGVQPRMEYRSAFLHAFLNTERVKSHHPVTLTRGNDQFSADSMDFDNLDRVMQLQGRVHGVLVPTPSRAP